MKKQRLDDDSQTTDGVFVKVAECLYRHKSSGRYYGLVKRGGKQFRRSLKTKDRKLAERSLKKFRETVSRLDRTSVNTSGKNKITFEDLAKQWFERVQGDLKPSSAKRRQSSIGQLKPFFGKVAACNINHRMCDEWVMRRGNKVAASTYNNERETLRAILDFAKRDGLILDNPAEAIKRRKLPKPAMVIPTREQFEKLLETMRGMDCRYQEAANLVELLAFSGMRLGEAVAILWSEIDFQRGVFTVTGGETGTKNHEARTVPMFPALQSLLERLKKETGGEGRVIRIDNAKNALATACKKASLPHFTQHSMRHYFVSNAIEAGVDFKVIAGWVGHKDGGVLVAQRYGHLRDAHSFEMAKRMTFGAAQVAEHDENIIRLKEATGND